MADASQQPSDRRLAVEAQRGEGASRFPFLLTLSLIHIYQKKRCARQPRGAAYAHGQVVRVGGLVHTDILSHCRAAYHAPRAAVYCC